MRLLPLAGLLLGLVGARAYAEDPPSPRRPATLADLDRLLAPQEGRLDDLVARAHRDPDWRHVERYLALRDEEFADGRRSPKARDLIAILRRADADLELRRAVLRALTSDRARSRDPELSDDRRRKQFSLAHVVEMLETEQDTTARLLARDWLRTMHGNAGDASIQRYDPSEAGKATWRAGVNAWKRILRR